MIETVVFRPGDWMELQRLKEYAGTNTISEEKAEFLMSHFEKPGEGMPNNYCKISAGLIVGMFVVVPKGLVQAHFATVQRTEAAEPPMAEACTLIFRALGFIIDPRYSFISMHNGLVMIMEIIDVKKQKLHD
jgi:hypothetical protein